MKGDRFEIRLFQGRAEVHYGARSTLSWAPAWSHVSTLPGGKFPEAVAEVRALVSEPGTGSVKRYTHMGVAEARKVHRFDVVDAGGGDVVANAYRVQLRPKGWKPGSKKWEV